MECAQVTEEQRLWTETQIQKAKHNAWLAELPRLSLFTCGYLTNPPVRSRKQAKTSPEATITSPLHLVQGIR